SGGLPAPRASISAFLSEELIMRSVDTARSFLAFIASVRALLMSSRSTVSSLVIVAGLYRLRNETAKVRRRSSPFAGYIFLAYLPTLCQISARYRIEL